MQMHKIAQMPSVSGNLIFQNNRRIANSGRQMRSFENIDPKWSKHKVLTRSRQESIEKSR